MKTIKLQLILALLISGISVCSSYGQVNCLVAWYELDGNATDQSGNNYDGVLYGTTPTADRFGNPNGALFFNGTSDYIDLPGDFDYTQRTLSLWIKSSVFPTIGGILFDSDNPGMQYGKTGISVTQVSGVNQTINHVVGSNTHSVNAFANSWYQVAIVLNATYIKFYVNGSIVDSVPRAGLGVSSSGHASALIGVSRLFDRYYYGAIDDVRIYNCALSNAQVTQLYTGKTDCLVAWYELNGNATDQSGNNYNGVLYGTTPTADRFGNPNGALFFNGTSDYIDLPNDFDYTQRTLSLWIKSSVFPTIGGILFDSDNPGMQYGKTGISVTQVSGVNQTINHVIGSNTHSVNAFANTWYQVAIVLNATYIKYYINGSIVDSVPRAGLGVSSSGHASALIGVSRLFDRYYYGAIDDLRIYSCALTNAEIDSLHVTGVGLNEINTESIFAIYPNPAEEYVTIETPEIALIEISNIEGQIITRLNINDNKAVIDISDFSSGVYIIRAQTNSGVTTKEFIKE
jgi:hypothetical protein